MSIQLMTLTWQTSLPLNQKAALLALSDWANDDGASLHPSIYALSERLTCSERTAQRLMRELEEGQWIAVVGNHNGGRPGATRNYRINVRKLRAAAEVEELRRAEHRRQYRHSNMDSSPDPFAEISNQTVQDGCQFDRGVNLSGVTNQVETGDKSGSRRVTNQAETGDTGVTLTTIEPSIEPPKNHQYAQAAKKSAPAKPQGVSDQTWSDWLQLRKTLKAAVTQTAIDGIAREATLAGYTLEQALVTCCANGWRGFKAAWVAPKMPSGFSGQPNGLTETPYQRAARQRVEEMNPAVARKVAGPNAFEQSQAFLDSTNNVIDVTPRHPRQPSLIGG